MKKLVEWVNAFLTVGQFFMFMLFLGILGAGFMVIVEMLIWTACKCILGK